MQAGARAVCEAVGVRFQPVLDDCILDVGETGDPALAAADAAVAAAGPALASSLATPAPAPSSSPTAGGPLTLGQTISGTIATTSQHDDYTFAARAGEIVYVQGHGACITGVGWSLLRPDGSDQDLGIACDDLGRQALLIAGTYTVRVSSDGSATGAYSFTLLPVVAKTTNEVSLGESITGSVSTVGAWHDYTFAAIAGEVVDLKAHGSCVTGLDWQLIGPDGSLQDFDLACHDIGRRVLVSPGIWTVRILGEGTATGAYGFEVGPAN